MNIFEILILAVVLGIDCLVVSFSQGLLVRFKRSKISNVLALVMGGFQAVMPVITYFLTSLVYKHIYPFAKPVVFGIFLFLGIKFIIEAIGNDEQIYKRLGYRMMILLGIATSIDALGAGVPLKLTDTNIVIAAVLIGIISYLMSLIGFWSTKYFENIKTQYLEISGGIVLIVLAIKALF